MAGDRLYKTGDRGRYLPEGSIEFAGRADRQVKIRGFRIELGEIETVAAQHAGVRAAVVIVDEDLRGSARRAANRLVAYVVLNEKAPALADLRTFLRARLPEYMIPAAFVSLKALPLTPNSKIDYRGLPQPEESSAESNPFVAPRTAVETRLAEIWTKVLGVQQVGITDNFFDLGGHSLLAVHLFAEIEIVFGKRILLSALFQGATIARLAELIDQSIPPAPQPALVAIQPHGSKRPFFCVHEFFGDVFCYGNLARYLGGDQPFFALQARGLDGTEEPLTDIKAMAAHYISQIQSVQPQGPYALGGLCAGGIVAFEMAQQLRAANEQVALLALFDSTAGTESGAGFTSRMKWIANLIRDLPAWLIGSYQLNRTQWQNLLRLKLRMAKIRKALSQESPAQARQTYSAKLIEEMGDLFHFSEQHRKVARAQSRALRNYVPEPYPGRVTLFRPRMQPIFSSHRRDKGWSALAVGGLEIRTVPGNHLAMLQEPHVRTFAQELKASLANASDA
jgi:thioesterase domain-containing protein